MGFGIETISRQPKLHCQQSCSQHAISAPSSYASWRTGDSFRSWPSIFSSLQFVFALSARAINADYNLSKMFLVGHILLLISTIPIIMPEINITTHLVGILHLFKLEDFVIDDWVDVVGLDRAIHRLHLLSVAD